MGKCMHVEKRIEEFLKRHKRLFVILEWLALILVAVLITIPIVLFCMILAY